MKSFLLFGSMLLLSQVGNAEPQFALSVTNIAVDNQDHRLPERVICFDSEWEAADPLIYQKILALRTLSTEAFITAAVSNETRICYDPTKVSATKQEDFDVVMALIQEKSENRVILPVPTDAAGRFAPHALAYKEIKAPPIVVASTPSPTGSVVLRNQDRSPFRKFLWATAVTQGAQIGTVGLLLLMPKSITKWPSNPYKSAAQNIKTAWTTKPVWDHDDWWINASHPYSGSIYYNLMRSQNASAFQSFLYSTFQSFFWEYVIEAGAEQPSIQDLLFTSTIGSVYGEFAHWATLRMTRNGFTFAEKALVTILNPGYVLNNGFRIRRR